MRLNRKYIIARHSNGLETYANDNIKLYSKINKGQRIASRLNGCFVGYIHRKSFSEVDAIVTAIEMVEITQSRSDINVRQER